MKLFKLVYLTLGVSVMLCSAALAQDLTVAVAASMTGSEAAIGGQFRSPAGQAAFQA